MLIVFIINFILLIMGFVLYYIPDVTLDSLPVIGSGLSSILTTAVSYFNGFMDTFPYAELLWDVFLFVILPFEIIAITLKLIFGARAPIHED